MNTRTAVIDTVFFFIYVSLLFSLSHFDFVSFSLSHSITIFAVALLRRLLISPDTPTARKWISFEMSLFFCVFHFSLSWFNLAVTIAPDERDDQRSKLVRDRQREHKITQHTTAHLIFSHSVLLSSSHIITLITFGFLSSKPTKLSSGPSAQYQAQAYIITIMIHHKRINVYVKQSQREKRNNIIKQQHIHTGRFFLNWKLLHFT